MPFPYAGPLPPDLAGPLERLHAAGRALARDVRWYPEVTSTNDLAARRAEAPDAAGCVIGADAQTAGRGRVGRAWWSPPGAGLYVSVILPPSSARVPLLTLAAGLSAAEAVAAATGLDPQVKWPNDLYAGTRKLGGLLAESSSTHRHVIVGLGINLRPAAYPSELATRATSIETELGRRSDRGLVLAAWLDAFGGRLEQLARGESVVVMDAWRQRAALTFGRAVEWDEGAKRCRGVAESVADDGALMVRTDGGIRRIRSGEVRWVER